MALFRAAALLAALLLSACAQPGPRTSADPAKAAEEQATASLKTQYKDIVSGTEADGTVLSVFVNLDNFQSMDESAEDALKAQALARWKSVWRDAHPHRHAKLRVRFRDYFGNDVYTESANV